MRKRLEAETKKKCIPVWHRSRGKENFIELCKQYDYVAIGGELSSEIEQDMNVVENNTPIYVDGRRTAITAYNINGSSYFKIRDIADAAGFEIQWDGDSQTINVIAE